MGPVQSGEIDMPIYQYRPNKNSCPYCRDGFDIMQSMSADPLKYCPKCSKPVHKVPSTFSGAVPLLSDGNLRDKGFTKLVRRDKGVYEKTT
jgi:putative FmdB family regulatory protein